jgi:hypothetical protein
MANLPSGSDGRRFTGREMKLIFERAGEADVAAQGEQGYSLAEMQEIALQVGLNPIDVVKAASTIRAPETSNPILGAHTHFHASRTLRARLTEDSIASVAVGIREATGLHGELRNVPGGAEWRARAATGLFVVDFTAKGDGTRIDLTIAREDEAVLTAVGSGVAGAIAGVIAAYFISNALGAVGFGEVVVSAVTALAGAAASVRIWWPRVARRWEKRTDALMQSISEAAEQSTNDTEGD